MDVDEPEAVIEDDAWLRLVGDADALLARCVAAARALEPRLAGGAAVLFADDAALRSLNARYRGVDKATNVLSFPASAAGGRFLGDVALASGVCEREAAERGLAPADHAAHLIVHGLLHLIGYDHDQDDEADVMERLETRILERMGVADPYAGADAASSAARTGPLP